MEESVTYQAILRKGEARGALIGAIIGAKKILLAVGGKRLGPADSRAMKALERINDLQRLEELGERLESVSTWQELLDLPAPRRRTGRRPPTP